MMITREARRVQRVRRTERAKMGPEKRSCEDSQYAIYTCIVRMVERTSSLTALCSSRVSSSISPRSSSSSIYCLVVVCLDAELRGGLDVLLLPLLLGVTRCTLGGIVVGCVDSQVISLPKTPFSSSVVQSVCTEAPLAQSASAAFSSTSDDDAGQKAGCGLRGGDEGPDVFFSSQSSCVGRIAAQASS